MPATPNLPTRPPCWPQSWLDGATEIDFPPSNLLKVYWNTDLTDSNGVPPNNIISIADAFEVCFRVELRGELWRCIGGTWCFDLCFDPCGKGMGFNLSDRLGQPDALHVKDWKGCDTRCVELCYTVPAGTITADECTTLYEIDATFHLHCCDKPAPVVGFDVLGHFQFYDPGA